MEHENRRIFTRVGAALLLSVLLSSCHYRAGRTSLERQLVEDLLSRIDSAEVYRARKEADIEDLKLRLAAADSTSAEWIAICDDIGNRYSNYITDSALVYYDRAIDRALEQKNKDYYLTASLGKIKVLNRKGYFIESDMVMRQIKLPDFPENLRWRYYSAVTDYYHSLYTNVPPGSKYRKMFTERYRASRDTLLALLPPDSENMLREMEKSAGRAGRIDEALKYNDMRFERLGEDQLNERALALYDRHVIYRYYMKRPVRDHVEYLLQSAILDVVCANQNVASLRFVEAYLTSEGDISSAKIVSDYYYETLLRFGSRTRLLDALDLSMRINNDYSRMLKRQQLYTWAGFIGSLILMLLLLLILRQVLLSRRHIEALNQDLGRSSKTALSYVLGFFNLYSSYISRLLSLRSKINVNVRKGNYDYVLALTDPSKDISGDELKGMYANFDSAFLDIYPDYVEQFNSLLRPECRIVPKSDEKLTMELRIFAVIKLGISDSAKISELLHCSIKTVYNKRSEVNAKLAVSKEVFLKKLADL